MVEARFPKREVRAALVYFGLAALAITTTRVDSGLAYIWYANAYLIAVLMRRPRREWLRFVAACAPASLLATGLIGVGWIAAPFLAAANMAEVLVAAFLLRRAHSSLMLLGSARWTCSILRAAGIAGPAAMAAVAMLPMWFVAGQQPAETFVRVVVGHGLSNMTFVPIFKLFLTGNGGLWRNRGQRWTLVNDLPVYALFVAVTAFVFVQTSLPLLFLPILPLTAIVFRGGSRRTALALMLLAAIGGASTMLGLGPLRFAESMRGFEMQFLQFYLLATVLTVVPISAQLRSRRLLAQRVRDSESRYRMLADHSSDIITHVDLDGRALFVSQSALRLAGYEPSEVTGRNVFDFIDPAHHAQVLEAHGRAIALKGEVQRLEYRGRLSNGEWRWFESLCRGVIGADGQVEGIVSIVRDISERRQREDALALAAHTDSLTGLSNRRAFREAAAAATAGKRLGPCAIALLDIDFFKKVNDNFGHDAGDEVLRTFAGLAQQLVRPDDLLARVGGEEFAILFPGLAPAAAAKVCERIRSAVATTPIVTTGGRIDITISGGVAALGDDGLDAALRRADQALYRAKSRGRDRLSLAA